MTLNRSPYPLPSVAHDEASMQPLHSFPSIAPTPISRVTSYNISMPPKSALPHGTTPRPPRRKKAVASKKVDDDNIHIEECDYRFGESAAVAQTVAKSAKKVRAKTDRVASRDDRDKENTLQVDSSAVSESKSQRHHDAMDELNQSMANVRLTSDGTNPARTVRPLRRIEAPAPPPFPEEPNAIRFAVSDEPRPLRTSAAALRDDDTSEFFASPSILRAVENASYSLKPEALLVLEEHAARLKNVVRHCLRRQGECAHVLDLHGLRVAIHCLRAIHRTFVKDRDVGIKLAFHCVLLAERGLSKEGRMSHDIQAVVECGMLRLAAYEVLSRFVDDRCLAWEDMLTNINIDEKDDGNLPKRQVLKICAESGICASSVFLEMGLSSVVGEGPSVVVVHDEFQFVSSVIASCREDGVSTSQNIVMKAVFPLVLELNVSDALRHVKKIFRLFWEGARSLETLSCNDALRMVALHLQCLAVTILARFVCETFPSSNEEERKEFLSLWDRASSSALKMVAVFDKGFAKLQDSEEIKNALLEVHSVAGGMLDNVWIQFYKHAGGVIFPPSSYYEYCAYRAIHQWKLLGSVDSFHASEQLLRDKDLHDCDNGECLAAMASLSVILMALEAREVMAGSKNNDISLTRCERVIKNFDHIVICNAPSTSQIRCRSMIMLLNLQGQASKIIASQSDSSGNGLWLSTFGYVLGRCMAPLELRLARLSDDPQRCLTLRLSASDNHAKSASFFDRAIEDSSKEVREKWSVECVRQLRKAFELLSPVVEEMEGGELKNGSPAVLAIEVFAKTASLIGRKRFDRVDMASSIECQVYATELLTRVALKCSSDGFFEKYQVSNRYMLLASALETNRNVEESCAALALAVWAAAKKHAHASSDESNDYTFVGDAVSEELLLFPEGIIFDNQFTSDKISFADALAVVINKLARACIEVSRSQRTVSNNVITRDTMLSKLLQTMSSCAMVTSELKGSINLARLLDFIVWDGGAFTIPQTLALVRALLKCMSKVLKCTLNDVYGYSEEVFSIMMHELKEFLRLQGDRLKGLVSPENLRVISSGLHVAFAMYLADSQILHFPRQQAYLHSDVVLSNAEADLLQYSLDQLQQSEELFSSAVEDSSTIRDVTFFAQWAAVHLHKAIMFEHKWLHEQMFVDELSDHADNAMTQQYSAVLEICNQAIREIVIRGEAFPYKSVESLIATLKRLLCRFSLHGDPESSSQCFFHLQKVYPLCRQSQRMFDSISDFLWISSKFDDLTAMLIRSCLFDSTQSAKSLLGEEILQLHKDTHIEIPNCIIDVVASTLSHLSGIYTEGDLESGNVEQLLQCISESIETSLNSMESNPGNDVMDFRVVHAKSEALIQLQSFVVTTLMLRSKLFLNARRPECSIKTLHSFRIQCKKMISLLHAVSSTVRNNFLDDKLVQVDDLISMGLELMSIAFSSLGIRRKAEDSAILACMKQKILSNERSLSKVTFKELLEYIELLDGQYNVLPSIRTLIKVKSLSLSPDKLTIESIPLHKMNVSIPSPHSSISRMVNRSRNLITYDDSFRHVLDFKNKCNIFLSLAHQIIVGFTHQSETDASSVMPLVTLTELELKLRIMLNENNNSGTFASLERIMKYPNSFPCCLADAYYDLGIEALEKARGGTELQALWANHSVVANDDGSGEDIKCESVTQHYTLHARNYFNCALRHAYPASSHTTKKILRCLALVTGPGDFSAFLIHASIGGAARSIVRDAISSSSRGNHDFNSCGRLHNLFNFFDDETSNIEAKKESFHTLLTEYSSILPESWVISGMALCPTGEILITSFRTSEDNEGKVTHSLETMCIFQQTSNVSGGLQSQIFHNDILSPLDRLIERSQKQLRGINEEARCEQYNDESTKRRWWNERHSIDNDLRSLLQRAEHTYFGHDASRRLLVTTSMDPEGADGSSSDDDSSECSDLGPGNLASRFEEAERDQIHHFDDGAERLALKKLTVAHLKEKLNELGIGSSQVQKMRKANLIDLIVTEMGINFERNQATAEKQTVPVEPVMDTPRNDDLEPCTILILDEHLHRLPLESMDMFANKAVSRMPSLPFVFAALSERRHFGSTDSIPRVDPNKVKFVIDPEQNLSETASRIKPALESMASANGWDWKGFVCEMPTPDFMTETLTEENSLLLYCGHGGGEKFFSRSQVEDLMNCYSEDETIRHRRCCSTVVLMGCSSGKLKSVNSPKNNPSGLVYPMYYEPEGIALSYIYAGAPCVVGNLWDVTDRDIDRYCLTLLDDFVHKSNNNASAPNLAKCVASARRACKLRYIVGSAPVCYGIPVSNL